MTLPTPTTPSSMYAPPSRPDPATDLPTVWAGTGTDTGASDRGRNTLALVSLLISLIFPIGVSLNVLSAVAGANHLPRTAIMLLLIVGGAIGTLGVPAMLGAIATGHVALVIAKRYSRAGARRWMAIVGLVVGYLSLSAFVGVLALFLVAGMNGF